MANPYDWPFRRGASEPVNRFCQVHVRPPPIVSVIIAAFNARRWIGLSVASAQSQTLREIEIIVVDDGSTDDTSEVVAGMAQSDSRIRLIRQANAGVGAARNTGIRFARGTYIAPLDADDVWGARKLERQVQRMEERGERTALVYCWHQWIDEEGAQLGYKSNSIIEGDARSAIILRNLALRRQRMTILSIFEVTSPCRDGLERV